MGKRRDEADVVHPDWLAELWQMSGRDPPENLWDGLAELRLWVQQMRLLLADRERRLEAYGKSLDNRQDKPSSAA